MPTQPRTALVAMVIGSVLAGTGTPVLGQGDCNGDGIVDLADYAEFPGCMAGPGGGPNTGCDVVAFDTDSDVDLTDFDGFQRVFGKVLIETVPVGNLVP